jgi:drug/metabolite transporter (DMT)-like permease
VTLVLGLTSGLCWGAADFFGGLQSRRLPALAVAFWSQVAGGVALLLALGLVGGPTTAQGLLWGMAGGVFGGLGLVLFYRGLAEGVMSVVAPISACGAAVPVFVALLRGEAPTRPEGMGIAAALAGVVLISLRSEPAPHSAGVGRGAVALALGAAIGFGMFFVFVDLGSASGASPLWAVAGARGGSLLTLLTIILAGARAAPLTTRRAPAVAGVGVLDTTANVLFAYAASLGNLGVASVLGSLYPVATMLLGRLVLGERLGRVQGAGAALALMGIGLLSAG